MMRTDDLIRGLVSDLPVRSRPVARDLALFVAAGFVLSLLGFLATLGPRPDIAAAAQTVRFDLKPIETLMLAASAAPFLLRLAQPGRAVGMLGLALAAAPLLVLIAVLAELLLVPSTEWLPRLIGANAKVCTTAIPLMSLPLLAAAFAALRHGAPTRPALAGAAAGLFAGGVAATLYAIHCPDDSPLFVATWYSIGIGAVTVLGALLGPRVLRW